MIKILLNYALAELCIHVLFDRLEANLNIAASKPNPFDGTDIGDTVLIILVGGATLDGTFCGSRNNVFMLEMFNEDLQCFELKTYPMSSVMSVQVLDDDDVEEWEWEEIDEEDLEEMRKIEKRLNEA